MGTRPSRRARRGVTERHYVRRPDAILVEAASRTAALIDKRLAGRQADVVTLELNGEARGRTAR
jgi:hypothetical protein